MPPRLPITEDTIQLPVNPYGRTKLMIELMLGDYARAYGFRSVALRYFNAAGADPDGQLTERHDPETHLIPRALMAAAGRLDRLDVFGDDYDTPDGTCIRDYIHVMDLAEAHVAAVDYLRNGGEPLKANLGSGHGTSVRQVIDAIHQVTRRRVPVAASGASRRRPAGAVCRHHLGTPDARLPAVAVQYRNHHPNGCPRFRAGGTVMTGKMSFAPSARSAALTAAPAGDASAMLVALFSTRMRIANGFGIAAWIVAFLFFWAWWLDPAHVTHWPSYVMITIVVGWITLLPAYFIFIFAGAKVAGKNGRAVPNGRIAMVVTKAPSEPFTVVRKTLLAMLDQIGCDYDVWLADEDPSPETIDWCARQGVLRFDAQGGC